MPVEIKLDDAEVRNMLSRLQERLGNLNPAMGLIGERLLANVRGSFDRESSPNGTPWAPLAASTVLDRRRKGYWPGKTLQRTGRLLQSIRSEASENRVEVGTDLPYAVVHQMGGVLRNLSGGGGVLKKRRAGKASSGPGRIPARPFLFDAGGTLPDPWIQACLEILQEELDKAMKG